MMITKASTDDKLRDMVVSQSDLEDGQVVEEEVEVGTKQ